MPKEFVRPVTVQTGKRLVITLPDGQEVSISGETSGGEFVQRLRAPEGTEIRYDPISPTGSHLTKNKKSG